jgi:hypothetical protein
MYSFCLIRNKDVMEELRSPTLHRRYCPTSDTLSVPDMGMANKSHYLGTPGAH